MQGKELSVFRETDSSDRSTLMNIRQGNVPVKNAWEIITRFSIHYKDYAYIFSVVLI